MIEVAEFDSDRRIKWYFTGLAGFLFGYRARRLTYNILPAQIQYI